MHFSQGDGEVSFCGAIEMSGFIELRCTVIKGGMKLLPVVGPSPLSVNPIFEIGPLEPRCNGRHAHAARQCPRVPTYPPAAQSASAQPHTRHPLPQTTLDSEFIVFEGISVDEEGNQHYLDATLAYKRAVLNAIKYLANFGYTEVCLPRKVERCGGGGGG